MKTYKFLKRSELEQDFELNIASIIDCFVVLIAFVLISTSFFSIGILDAVVAGAHAQASNEASETVVIQLRADRSIQVKLGSAAAQRIAAKGADQKWDFERLTQSLSAMKSKVKALDTAVVSADNSVAYRDVMASMEIAKAHVGKVNLGGL